ncbi:hypothetical protein G6L37_30710 [Agrobacterium rubi]|nr:hypothetical protein [Agrobacterium rubi]NTF22782.1 hypothetical protein [Agrobacterium rubi]NTF29644.1 hypothetical protein [Agrobacterium rubi]
MYIQRRSKTRWINSRQAPECWHRPAQLVHKPAQPVVVVDTTGAGDAFNAGFINAWLNGEANTDCVEAGIYAGTLSVQVAGGAGVLL